MERETEQAAFTTRGDPRGDVEEGRGDEGPGADYADASRLLDREESSAIAWSRLQVERRGQSSHHPRGGEIRRALNHGTRRATPRRGRGSRTWRGW
jgi:hypothetical protein